MSRCPHCKGTGIAPIRLQQECIGCQRKVMVTFADTAEMAKTDGRVFCKDCQPVTQGDIQPLT